MVDGELVLILAHFSSQLTARRRGIYESSSFIGKSIFRKMGFRFFIYITTSKEFHGGLLGEGSLLHSACDILLPYTPSYRKDSFINN